MTRFLLTTLGSLGDLHPFIAVGRSLIARGQHAVLAASEEYRGLIVGAGGKGGASDTPYENLGIELTSV